MTTSNLGVLTLSFLKIGIFSLGGGNSMIQLIEHECVNNHHWLSSAEFNVITGSTFLFPGLTAVKIAALIGFKVAGFWGMLLAVLSLNLPGIILALLFINLLQKNKDNNIVKKLIIFVQYGGMTLLACATYIMFESLISVSFSWRLLIYSAILFIMVGIMDVSPFYGLVLFLIACFAF